MRYLSLCSGIEGASVAWQPLGWQSAAFAETDAFCSAVLKAHYPSVPNLGDITQFREWPDLGTVDLVCGGTPCQSFSVAGLRAGLADPRGDLMLTYLAIVGRYRPRWVVWENVPGVLSSNGGRDFGTFLSGLGQLGYGWAYRVLDAQYVRVDGFPRAVPQRRRRVWVVGCPGDWAGAAAVLSERQSLLGDTPPRRKARQRPAPTIASRASAGGGLGTDFDCDGGLIATALPGVSGTVSSKWFKGSGGPAGDEAYNLVAHTLRGEGFDAGEDGTGRGLPLVASNARMDPVHGAVPGALDTDGLTQAIAIQERAVSETPGIGSDGKGWRDDGASYTVEARTPQAVAFDMRGRQEGSRFEGPHDTANIRAASGGSSRSYVAAWQVRRLTPTECERLQGFPDGYTAVTWRGKPAADGPRYRALGNAWAVNCARWVGRRIEMVETLAREAAA
jgi:DNA (cytosine-5)-methyltransferase 1